MRFFESRAVSLCAVLMVAISAGNVAQGQRRLVDEVKYDLNSQSLTVSNYTSALSKLIPALSDSATMEDAEAWYLAGKICFDKYDKYRSLATIGQKADEADMGTALIDGYSYFMNALKFDSVPELDKKGAPKTDKKTGKPKVKARFSKEIIKTLSEHYTEFRYVGKIFYSSTQKFGSACQAWEVYTSLPYDDRFPNLLKKVSADEIGEYRFYQGVAAKLDGDYASALVALRKALEMGYKKRDVYDYAISCAEHEDNDSALVDLAVAAYQLYGKDNPRYIRLLFNYAIKYKKYGTATSIMDQAIADYPDKAEYYDLKGVLLEHENDNIEGSYEYFKKAVELDPEFLNANFDMGRYYMSLALGEDDEDKKKSLMAAAMPYFEKVLQKEPGNKVAKDALRNIYYNLNDPKYESLGK